MRKGIFASFVTLIAGAGLAWAQPVAPITLPKFGQTSEVWAPEQGLFQPLPPGSLLDIPPHPRETDSNAFSSSFDLVAGTRDPWADPDHWPLERFWVSGEYLLWWVKDGSLPVPLVTSGRGPNGGILGDPFTVVEFGGSPISYQDFSGGRLEAGIWLNRARTFGLEGNGFLLEEKTNLFRASSDAAGRPLLARPFQAVTATAAPAEAVLRVASPAALAGSIESPATTQLWGTEINLVRNLWRGQRTGFDLLAGFRYLELDEDFAIYQRTAILANGIGGFNGTLVTAPNALLITDRFDTRNQFYGGQLGVRAAFRNCGWLVDTTLKLGLGSTRQRVHIDGTTSLLLDGFPLPAATVPGGLLAVPTNIGQTAQNEFTVAPELGVKIGYQLTAHFSAHVGYSFLYWPNVVRPGDQIDRRVNPAQVPSSLLFGPLTGPRQPAVLHQDTDFWAQGISFGLAFRY